MKERGNTVLVVDGGGRGTALVDKYSQSPHVDRIIAVPGNDWMSKVSEKTVKIFPDIKTTDVVKIATLSQELGVKVISWPKTEKSEKTGCSMPWTNPYITYGGDVLPCCFIPQELEGRKRDENIMGNIYKDDFKTIWKSEKFTTFRKRMKNGEPPLSCKICPNFYGLS